MEMRGRLLGGSTDRKQNWQLSCWSRKLSARWKPLIHTGCTASLHGADCSLLTRGVPLKSGCRASKFFAALKRDTHTTTVRRERKL